MIVTKYLSNKAFDYIDPWDDNHTYIACMISTPYHHILKVASDQAAFERDMIYNFVSVVYWCVKISGI